MASETATPSYSPTETPSFSPAATPSNPQPDSEDESATSSADDSEPVSNARLVSDEITCSECPANCTECSSSTECRVCEEGLLLHDHECVTSCPPGTKEIENKCLPCSVLNCELCSEGISTCAKCKEGLVLYENKCRQECPVGYIDVFGICEKCDGSCYDCVETKTKCTSCNAGSTLDESANTCSGSCNDGYVTFNSKCEKCVEGCSTCKDAKTTCTSCDAGSYLHHNQCISTCPKGYTYVEEDGNVCVHSKYSRTIRINSIAADMRYSINNRLALVTDHIMNRLTHLDTSSVANLRNYMLNLKKRAIEKVKQNPDLLHNYSLDDCDCKYASYHSYHSMLYHLNDSQ